MNPLYAFLSGAVMLGAWTAGLFFIQFWTRTRDQLFFWFGIAFWILAAERVAVMFLLDPERENQPVIYLMRLTGFALILVAIVRKNRARGRRE